MIRRRYKLLGKVQGVGLRWQIKQLADSLNLTGWVRNENDPQIVSLEIQGRAEVIENFDAWLRQGVKQASFKNIIFTNQPLDNDRKFYIQK
ncbi:MAG: acylphosphatase [Patescibacteria group bacterium]